MEKKKSKKNKYHRFGYFSVSPDMRSVILGGTPHGDFAISTRRGGKSNDINRVFQCMALVMSDSDWEVVRMLLAQHDHKGIE